MEDHRSLFQTDDAAFLAEKPTMPEVARVYENEVIDRAKRASSPSSHGGTDALGQGLAAVAFALLEVAQAIREAARKGER